MQPAQVPPPANDDTAWAGIAGLSSHPSVELAAGTQTGRAYAMIRGRILQLDLAPGAPIIERELIEETGLGRTPVREALLRLAVERLVTIVPGRGLQVAPVGIQEVRDLYEVRLQEDRLAGRLCLLSAEDAALDAITGAFAEAEAAIARGDDAAVFDMDFRFHAAFYAAAGNAVLSANHHLLVGHYYRVARLAAARRRGARTAEGMAALVRSHDAMIDALRRRDGEALDRAIVQHTVGSLHNVIEVLTGLRTGAVAGLSMRSIEEVHP